jgi:glycosyltransferase involved in cell wall biosynthesis
MHKKVLVTTSTFPRWKNDNTPTFIKDLTRSYSSKYKIKVLSPHFNNSLVFEKNKNYDIKRYRYFYPYKFENLVYEGGGGAKVKISFFYALKLFFLLTSQFINVFYYRITGFKTIHAHWIIPQGFIAVLLKKIINTKVIVSVHGSDISTLNGGIFKQAKKFTLKNADIVTVNSSNTGKLCAKLHQRDYVIIPMGIDTTYFKKRPTNPNNKIIKLVFVGRFTEEKGIDNLVNILNNLKQKTKFKINIIGDGEKKSTIEAFIKNNNLSDSVTLLGWLPKEQLINSLYKSDIFLSTSNREAQGIAIIEALSCGLPVISTNVGGVSDAVKDGFNGFLINKGNVDNFVDKINILNENRSLLNELSINASVNLNDKYSWGNIGKKFEELLG